MGVVDGVGRGPMTPVKLAHFQDIARMWCAVVWNIFQKPFVAAHNPRVLYVDATSGPGWRDGQPSCCIHFLDAIQRRGLPYRAVLIEKDWPISVELANAVEHYHDATVLWNDYQSVLTDRGRFPSDDWQFGLLYVDPNGPSELHFDAITRFCKRLPRVDFLTYTSATALKRYWKGNRLSDIVGTIPKQRWFVRLPEPGDPAHWTFLLGTGDGSPIKQLAKVNLLAIDDPRLSEAWFKMEYTADEQKKILQPSLMDLIENTCDTQPIELSGLWRSSDLAASASAVRSDL